MIFVAHVSQSRPSVLAQVHLPREFPEIGLFVLWLCSALAIQLEVLPVMSSVMDIFGTLQLGPILLLTSSQLCGRLQGRIQGEACPAHAPQGSTFLHFNIQNFRNVTASGVGVPPLRGRRPLREILDPPLV